MNIFEKKTHVEKTVSDSVRTMAKTLEMNQNMTAFNKPIFIEIDGHTEVWNINIQRSIWK